MDIEPLENQLLTGDRVRMMLEKETNGKYELKAGRSLVHKDGTKWFIHLALNRQGPVDVAYQTEKVTVLETAILFDVINHVQHSYPESFYVQFAGRLKRDVGNMQKKEERQRYAKTLPDVVAFFDNFEKELSVLNAKYSTHIMMVNNDGALSARAEFPNAENAQNEQTLMNSVKALVELDKFLSSWVQERSIM